MKTLPDMGAWERVARGINLEGWHLVRESLKSDWQTAISRFGLPPRFATRVGTGTLQDMESLGQGPRLGLIIRDAIPLFRAATDAVPTVQGLPAQSTPEDARFRRFCLLYLMAVQRWCQEDALLASAMAVMPIEAVVLLAELDVLAIVAITQGSDLRFGVRHAAGLELLSVTIYSAKSDAERVATTQMMAMMQTASREWH